MKYVKRYGIIETVIVISVMTLIPNALVVLGRDSCFLKINPKILTLMHTPINPAQMHLNVPSNL